MRVDPLPTRAAKLYTAAQQKGGDSLMGQWTKLDQWVKDVLVDPFGKGPLSAHVRGLVSAYGLVFPTIDGVLDFRRKIFVDAEDFVNWRSGQEHYETWARQFIDSDATQDYDAEISEVRDVYRDIPLEGRVLDVGGYQGRVREFLHSDQEYLSCDPFIGAFNGIERQTRLLSAFACFKEPCNFISCHAEHLPLRQASFDTVHMRSVIDHFLDPALALIEAKRVLRPNGKLIVGLYVEGGKDGRMTPSEHAKETGRHVLSKLGVGKFRDHHVWHPTFVELCSLIEAVGFLVRKVHWQQNTNERVCYLEARSAGAA